MLLGNEPLARKGYVFKSPILTQIFKATDWYEPIKDSAITTVKLNDLERKNVSFVKTVEDPTIYKYIADWLNSKVYVADEQVYNTEDQYRVPLRIAFAFSHFRINISRVLRSEIYARNGQEFEDPFLKKIFSSAVWYKPGTEDSLSDYENANLALLQNRELIEILDSQRTSLPSDVEYIPVLGYNNMYLKKLKNNYTYSTHILNETSKVDSGILKGMVHYSDGISSETIDLIKQENDPTKALQIYFDNKQYYGIMDTNVIDTAALKVPDYLEKAVESIGTTWSILLKKEIHARHGARFVDSAAGIIFTACSWYEEKYDLTLDTVIRLPSEEPTTKAEKYNFCLLEGVDLQNKKNEFSGYPVVADLVGNIYIIKIGRYYDDYEGTYFFNAAYFNNLEEYENNDFDSYMNQIVSDFYIDLISEDSYEYMGCE